MSEQEAATEKQFTPEQELLFAMLRLVKAMDDTDFAIKRVELLADLFVMLLVYAERDLDAIDKLVEGKIASRRKGAPQ